MANDRIFYRCEVCGNIVGMIENAGITPECCGQPMIQLEPNTTDAAAEKHVPVAERERHHLTVSVGSAPHPMTDAHHIVWVAVAQGRRTQRQEFLHTEPATTMFHVEDGPVKVYAYCNLHGLWEAEA